LTTVAKTVATTGELDSPVFADLFPD